MAEILLECCPPEDYLPETIQLLPELNYPQELNLAEVLLDGNAAEQPDKVAIHFENERITYRELRESVNRFANALRELGVGMNDRVMLRSPNRPEYLIWNSRVGVWVPSRCVCRQQKWKF